MSQTVLAHDVSPDGYIELYLYQNQNGEDVDVSIWINNLAQGYKARLTSIDFNPEPGIDREYHFALTSGDNPNEGHPDYIEYAIGPPIKNIVANFKKNGGPASQANAIAL